MRVRVLKAVLLLLAIACAFLAIRAFRGPVPQQKLQLLHSGMSAADIKAILGEPSRVIPGRSYAVQGTNYTTAEQWAYQRFLVFGSLNLHFDTRGSLNLINNEEF